MIGRRNSRKDHEPEVEPKGFDDFDLKLGDVMRGERATMGKSLLDVQRELRIKAAYIAAIENADPSAFDTPGFIAGYVRSYARYLGMDPDKTFEVFCRESGFSTAHGMSQRASAKREGAPAARSAKAAPAAAAVRDPFVQPSTPFAPGSDSFLSRVEPGAIGSALVLLALIGAIGFGGFSVLKEIQRVQLAPVDQTPIVLSDLDPLQAARPSGDSDAGGEGPGPMTAGAEANEALDRLYRPQALDVPVLVARDAPISTLDPATIGSFARERVIDVPPASTMTAEIAAPEGAPPLTVPQVVEETPPKVALFAVRPAWVRVRAADGSVIFEKILDAGEEYVLPQTEEPPTLRAGMSGSLYFDVNGELYGPAGSGTNTAKNIALSEELIRERFQVADLKQDPEAAKIVALAQAQQSEDAPAD